MAAGLGFKDFTTGEVLTAADVDGYLMQGIWVFASAAARDAAVTSPQEGNFAFLKDTNTTTYYTGSAWTNLDTTGMVNPMTTTGDMIYSSSGSTPARLGIGTANQQLRVNAGATAPEWFTPAAAGSGLTLVDEVSYTSATTVNVNDVFSATYDNYRIFNRATMASAASWTMKMRVSGTDTSSGYFNQQVYGDNTTAAGNRNTSGTDEWFFGDASNSGMQVLDLMSPYLAAETQGLALAGYRDASAGVVRMNSVALGDTTSYTGFSLLTPQAATGRVSIYGYAKE